MVIGTLALLLYFVMVAVMGAGQRLRREPEETKSCRTGGICTSVRPSVRPSVRMSVCPPVSPSPQAPQRLTQAPQRLTQASQRLTKVFLKGRGGRTDGLTYIRMDVQIPPVLQDFVSSGSVQSRCPKRAQIDQIDEIDQMGQTHIHICTDTGTHICANKQTHSHT